MISVLMTLCRYLYYTSQLCKRYTLSQIRKIDNSWPLSTKQRADKINSWRLSGFVTDAGPHHVFSSFLPDLDCRAVKRVSLAFLILSSSRPGLRSSVVKRITMADRLAAVRRETTPAGSPSPVGLGASSPLGPLPEAGITARPIPIPTMSPAMSFGPESKSTPVPKETLTHLDIMPKLLHSEHSVVKTRSGAVLSRGFIMKTDHYPSGE
jgi:hypothetical protein